MSRRDRPILLRLPIRPPHSAGFSPSSVSLMTFYVVSVPSFVKLPLLVDYPYASVAEPELAAILMNSNTSDVQSLPSPVPLSAPQVYVQPASPSLPNLDDCKWPSSLESRLSEPYQLSTAIPSMIAVLPGRCCY